MNNKKLGVIILLFGIIIAVILVNIMGKLNTSIATQGCYPNDSCRRMESSLSITNFAFGVIGFIIGLGFYLFFLTGGEEALLNVLQEEKDIKVKDNKFNILMQALDQSEQKVLQSIKDQDGITQNTLRLKTNLSKTKISYVVNDLEKRGLIKRIPKSKTFAIYLSANL